MKYSIHRSAVRRPSNIDLTCEAQIGAEFAKNERSPA